MAWSLAAHIRDHADYYINPHLEFDFKKNKMRLRSIDDNKYFFDFNEFKENYFDIESSTMLSYLENESKLEKSLSSAKHNKFIHFKLSFNLADFEDENEAYEILKQILIRLKNYTIEVEEKNGVRVKKDGTRVQKYRKRKIEIGRWLLAGAVHTRGFDEKWLVNPHIHLLFYKKKARLGKNFIYLKKAILDIKKELKIKQKTSFQEKSISISRKFKSVMNARSWAIRQGKNLQKKTFELFESDVIKYLEKSKNVEFALKSFILLEERGRAYGFYPVFLENKIKEFIYNFLDFRENEVAILKLIKKERFYIKNEKDSPFKYFFTEKMYFDVRDFVFLIRNLKKDFYPEFTITTEKREEQSQQRGMSR